MFPWSTPASPEIDKQRPSDDCDTSSPAWKNNDDANKDEDANKDDTGRKRSKKKAQDKDSDGDWSSLVERMDNIIDERIQQELAKVDEKISAAAGFWMFKVQLQVDALRKDVDALRKDVMKIQGRNSRSPSTHRRTNKSSPLQRRITSNDGLMAGKNDPGCPAEPSTGSRASKARSPPRTSPGPMRKGKSEIEELWAKTGALKEMLDNHQLQQKLCNIAIGELACKASDFSAAEKQKSLEALQQEDLFIRELITRTRSSADDAETGGATRSEPEAERSIRSAHRAAPAPVHMYTAELANQSPGLL